MADKCPQCGGVMQQTEKYTGSGDDWRTFTCVSCGRSVDENRGKAMWAVLSDAREEDEAYVALKGSLPPDLAGIAQDELSRRLAEGDPEAVEAVARLFEQAPDRAGMLHAEALLRLARGEAAVREIARILANETRPDAEKLLRTIAIELKDGRLAAVLVRKFFESLKEAAAARELFDERSAALASFPKDAWRETFKDAAKAALRDWAHGRAADNLPGYLQGTVEGKAYLFGDALSNAILAALEELGDEDHGVYKRLVARFKPRPKA